MQVRTIVQPPVLSCGGAEARETMKRILRNNPGPIPHSGGAAYVVRFAHAYRKKWEKR